MEKSKFSHKIVEVVKFHEVDMLGVCNNSVYFTYFEDARIRYLHDLKFKRSLSEILDGNSFVIMAHNECDYLEPSVLHDELNVYTRIDFIRNTSFGLKHIVENVKTGRIIAKGSGVMVHIDKHSKKPMPIPEEFYDAVKSIESEVKILKV